MEKIYKRFGPNYVPRNWYPADRFIYTVLNSYNYTKPLFNMRLNRSTVTGNIRSNRRRIKNMNSMFKTYYNRVNQQRKNNKPKPKPKSTPKPKPKSTPKPKPKSTPKPKPKSTPKPKSKLKQKKKIILKTRLRRRLRRLTGRLRRVKNRKRRIRIKNRLKNIRKQLS
jgi:D-alanyl-D-alanine carboxypeptidase